jgi:hypothetical protein
MMRQQNPRTSETRVRPRTVREVFAPTDASGGILGRAFQTGNYQAFRTALVSYEDWLRKRIGRWVQRYPEAEARLGRGLAIGDILEEVYLNAFEQYGRRPIQVPFHVWLDGLIDPSLKMLLKHPDEEGQNASFARTMRLTRGLS